MDGKNVLVTGANGHVGYALTRLLVERGYNVRASVRNKNDQEKAFKAKYNNNNIVNWKKDDEN